jgi:hypothetical protein
MANNSVVGSSNGGLIVASDCFSGGCLLCHVLQRQQLVGCSALFVAIGEQGGWSVFCLESDYVVVLVKIMSRRGVCVLLF